MDTFEMLKRLLSQNEFELLLPDQTGAKEKNTDKTDIQIVAENILKTKKKLNEILAANTGQPVEKITEDTERDNFMSAQEAQAYGLIDRVITNHESK